MALASHKCESTVREMVKELSRRQIEGSYNQEQKFGKGMGSTKGFKQASDLLKKNILTALWRKDSVGLRLEIRRSICRLLQ